jgi:excisionase family DNA binding protein
MSSATEAQRSDGVEQTEPRDVSFYDVHEVSRKLDCSDVLTRELIASGELGHIRIGRLIRVSSVHLAELARRKDAYIKDEDAR